MSNEALAIQMSPPEPAPVIPIRPWKDDDRTRHYYENAKSPNTIRGYRRDFARFEGWCQAEGFDPLPTLPVTVARYATARAEQGKKISHIRREIAAVAFHQKEAGHVSPTGHHAVKRVLAGIAREHGSAVVRAPPILVDDLRAMVRACDLSTRRGARDAAVLLVGFTMALRRSELVALDVEDLEVKDRGIVATIRHQKNDKEGHGMRKAVVLAEDEHLCCTRALKRWLRVSGRTSGALFCTVARGDHLRETRLSAQGVNRVVKRYAKLAGLGEMRFSAHSLRAGFVTSAAQAGKDLATIQLQTGHKSVNVLMQYVRKAVELGEDNPTAGLL